MEKFRDLLEAKEAKTKIFFTEVSVQYKDNLTDNKVQKYFKNYKIKKSIQSPSYGNNVVMFMMEVKKETTLSKMKDDLVKNWMSFLKDNDVGQISYISITHPMESMQYKAYAPFKEYFNKEELSSFTSQNADKYNSKDLYLSLT